MNISIVTGNTWKYEQITSILSDTFCAKQIHLDIPEIQTNLLTEISIDKCKKASSIIQWPVIVDDSGIYFDAYHDFPGALSKYMYTWIGLTWIQKLFDWVENKQAHFQTVLWYMDETMTEPRLFIGECTGTISFDWLDAAEGDLRLPYDLIFIPDWYDSPAYFNMSSWILKNARIIATRKCNERLMQRV